LEQQGMPEVFSVIVTSGDEGYRKPHPCIFETALRHLNFQPNQVAVVGDSYEWDIVPAANLGLITVLKLNERRPDPSWVLAGYQVPSLAALLQLEAFTRLRATQTWRSPARPPPRD
jgi:FMN phosphatase YigB (HAD superfamily)